MVAIALALSCLYGKRDVYSVMDGKRTLKAFEPETSFASMQGKLRNLIYNRKVTRSMPLVPDRFTDMTESRIVRAVRSGKTGTIYARVEKEVDRYIKHVEDNI
jgi:hypothetical protein